MEDRLKVINFLLDNRSDIDIKAGNEWTALHFSCFNGYLEIIDLLLERKASIWLTCPVQTPSEYHETLDVIYDFPPQGLGIHNGRNEILDVFKKHGKYSKGYCVGRLSITYRAL